MIKHDFLEWFFVFSINDLQKRHDGNIYDLIRGAGILRQILMDQAPLIDQANKNYKLKICYKVKAYELDSEYNIHWNSPIPPNDNSVTYVDRQKLLKYPVCIYNHHTYTIRDLIDYFCHIMGGIHSGKPKEEKEDIFTKIHRIFFPILEEWPSHSIKQIMSIVLEASKPLVEEIKGRTPTGGFSPQSSAA